MAGSSSLSKRLVIKAYHINRVSFSAKTAIEGRSLNICKEGLPEILACEPLVSGISVDILNPGELNKEIFTILDFFPVATKVLGKVGEGITHTLTGVVVALTAADASGRPLAQFGSSAGILKEKLILDRPGTPSREDAIILCEVTLQENAGFTRAGIMAAHRAVDTFVQTLRESLKKMDGSACTEKHVYEPKGGAGKKRVALVKLIAGQGAMQDNLVLPAEPCGYRGGRSIIDVSNMPVVLTPNEYRDGALRAMT